MQIVNYQVRRDEACLVSTIYYLHGSTLFTSPAPTLIHPDSALS